MLETSNFVHGSAMQSLSLVMSECFVIAKFHYTDPTTCTDFVRVGSGPCRVRVVEFSYYATSPGQLQYATSPGQIDGMKLEV